MVSWRVPKKSTNKSPCRPSTGVLSLASSAWSPMQVWSVPCIRCDKDTREGADVLLFWKTLISSLFLLQSIMNWAKNDVAYNSDSKLFFFSFVAFACGQVSSYPLAVIRTQQQAQGNTSVCLRQLQILTMIVFYSLLVWFPAFRADSRSASRVLPGLLEIYEQHGLKGYYGGMGASFVRAVPCALINYALTRKFENLFSSMDSWGKTAATVTDGDCFRLSLNSFEK